MNDIIWYEFKLPNYFKLPDEDGYEVRIIDKKNHEVIFVDVLKEKDYLELKEISQSDKMALLNILHDKFNKVAKVKIKNYQHKEIPDINNIDSFIDDDSYYL